MYLKANPVSKLTGKIRIPGSKSQSVRAFFVASLAKGESKIHNIPEGEDVDAVQKVVQSLGIKTEKLNCHENCVKINSAGTPFDAKANFWTENSGITTRFLLPILGLSKNANAKKTINCGDQMKKRLIESYVKNLEELGLNFTRKSWPLEVNGTLEGGKTDVDGITSQYVSGLLLSGIYAKNNMHLKVKNLNERPYMYLTLDWLEKNNIKYEHFFDGEYDEFIVFAGQNYMPIDYSIPSDFSSASSLLIAGVIKGENVELSGLDVNDKQGDKRLLEILIQMGANLTITGDTINLQSGQKLKGMTIDANDIPDMVPSLAILATVAEGGIDIVNVPQARFKETDRIHSMCEGLQSMGIKVEERQDGMKIHQGKLKSAKINGYDDHRTVMAFAVASLIADGELAITTPYAVNKTYPEFYKHMNLLGADLQITAL